MSQWLEKLDVFLRNHFSRLYMETILTKFSLQIGLYHYLMNLYASPVFSTPKEFYKFLMTLDFTQQER